MARSRRALETLVASTRWYWQQWTQWAIAQVHQDPVEANGARFELQQLLRPDSSWNRIAGKFNDQFRLEFKQVHRRNPGRDVRGVDTLKRQTSRQHFNRSERCLTCRYLQKTSRIQADDQFLPVPEGQSSDLNPTDPVKQMLKLTVWW